MTVACRYKRDGVKRYKKEKIQFPVAFGLKFPIVYYKGGGGMGGGGWKRSLPQKTKKKIK